MRNPFQLSERQADLLGRAAWVIAPLALVAWFALLWFMFGDVL